MLILTAGNVTDGGRQLEIDGLSNYTVWVGVNHNQIWAGPITGHTRKDGAAALLRKIADAMDAAGDSAGAQTPSPVRKAILDIVKHPACPKCGSNKLRCSANGCTWEVT